MFIVKERETSLNVVCCETPEKAKEFIEQKYPDTKEAFEVEEVPDYL